MIDLIVLHCSDTRPSQNFTIEKLMASHKARGFGPYPGYHIYIRRDGTAYYCRPLSLPGCHVSGYNAHSIGICTEGGHREDHPPLTRKYEDNRTAEQKVVVHEVLTMMHAELPEARIVGHHDLNPGKACPCYDARREYAYIS